MECVMSQLEQVPAPYPLSPIPPQQGCNYSSALNFALEVNPLYARGICYVADFEVSQNAKDILKNKLDKVIPQPEFTRGTFNADGILVRKVPGLIELQPGIPYAIRHTGVQTGQPSESYLGSADKEAYLSRLETRLAFHTPRSVSEYPGHASVFD
jgi:hypothetical protein